MRGTPRPAGQRFDAIAVAQEAAGHFSGGAPLSVWLVEGNSYTDGLLAGNAAARDTGVVLVGQAGAAHAASAWADAPRVRVGAWDAGVQVDTVHQAADAATLSTNFASALPPTDGYALASMEDFPDGLAGGAHAAPPRTRPADDRKRRPASVRR